MEIFFKAEKPEGKPDDDPILVPVIMTDDGGGIVINKQLNTIWDAFMLGAGFSLARFIESEGGLAAIQEHVDKREADEQADAETKGEKQAD